MKKILTLLVLALGIIASAFAQQKVSGSIKGKLIDSMFKENLSEATVTVLHAVDSEVVAYTIANAKGEFEIKDLDTGAYRLTITYSGYQPFVKKFKVTPDSFAIVMGPIYMDKKSTLLAEVIVEAPPIQVKKDTVEFSARAFKTKANANAEDLLKKLPGVQVDKDGNVKAQGEDIQKVYVDGKEFFGTDPKLATKNITADMIESVQVFDDMSDQAKFSRIDDGSRSKTINIKLKKDKRKGYFGRLIAGGGTDDRYETSLMFNKFNGDQRFSILAGSNNLNKQGFSFSDIVSTIGASGGGARGGGGNGGFGGGGNGGGGNGGRGGGGFGGGGFGGFGGGNNSSGIAKTHNVGINYTDKWGSKLDVQGSYFFSSSDRRSQQESFRQTSWPGDSTSLESENTFSNNKNQNHRFNLRMEYYIDSMNSLLYTPSLTVQHSESYSEDSILTRAIKPGLDYIAIRGTQISTSERDGINLNNNLLYRRRFHKPGRTLTLGINNSISNSDVKGTTVSPLSFFDKFGNSNILNQNFQSAQETKSMNNVISSSYTEPIGNNKLLEFNYAYTDRHNTSDKLTYNLSSSGKYDSLNLAQTNYFENDFIAHRGGANFRVQTKKYNFQLGGAVEYSELESRSKRALTGKDTTVKQSFTNFFPTANFNYTFSRTKNLRISYRGRTNQPSISQLQDVPDVSNPLRVTTGNPSLKQEFSNNFNLNYSTFNIATFKFLSININLSNTQNKIVNSIASFGSTQFIRPVNLNGAYNGSSFVTLGMPLKGSLKGSNINFNNSMTYNNDVSLVNETKNTTKTFIVTQTAGINLDIKQKLNLGLNASLAYNKTGYSDKSNSNLNDEYYTQTYSADIAWTFFKSLILSTDFDYYINTGRSDGFNQSIPLWNSSLAMQIFKKKNGEIKFSVNDLLNQNQSINRTVTDNSITDTRSVVLKRYFMLTFTYNLNRAGNQQRPGGMPNLPRNIQRRMDNIRVDGN